MNTQEKNQMGNTLPAEILGSETMGSVTLGSETMGETAADNLQASVDVAVSRTTQNSRRWDRPTLRLAYKAARPIIETDLRSRGQVFTRDEVKSSVRTLICSIPCLRSAEVVITTSAPARRYLITSSTFSTPVLAASDALS